MSSPAGPSSHDDASGGALTDPDDARPATPASEALELFREYRRSGSRALRNQLVERHMSLAEPHVRRFSGKGLTNEDLRQAALLSMLGAVERFDPELGISFATFASRTIDGELKRQLRDKGWLVRPPRRHQEVYLAVRKAEDELEQRLSRSPTVAEIASAIQESVDAVLEAIEAGAARRGDSLDRPGRREPILPSSGSGSDGDFGRVEARMLVAQLMEGLDERERAVIELRFFENLGQPEIAERLELSQSYVSRLIRRVLKSMKDDLSANQIVPGDGEAQAGHT
ncbi:MAG: sigma-70 family RNA polymerase sigma factor [Aquihabitans sp.]